MALNTSIRGLQIKDAFFGAGLARNGSDGDIMDIQVDDSSIEINSDSLRVKALGITNAMLAGSIEDGKLTEDYVKTSEVDGTTIEFGSGSLNIVDGGVDTTQLADEAVEVGKLAINNAEQDGYVLTWNDSGYLEWTSKTSTDAVANTDLKVENESANCDGGTTDFTLDSTPVVNSVQVFLNGLLQEEGSGKDYTLSGTTVSFATAPESGDILLIHYVANA